MLDVHKQPERFSAEGARRYLLNASSGAPQQLSGVVLGLATRGAADIIRCFNLKGAAMATEKGHNDGRIEREFADPPKMLDLPPWAALDKPSQYAVFGEHDKRRTKQTSRDRRRTANIIAMQSDTQEWPSNRKHFSQMKPLTRSVIRHLRMVSPEVKVIHRTRQFRKERFLNTCIRFISGTALP